MESKSVLVVQCCSLVKLVFACLKLRQREPHARLFLLLDGKTEDSNLRLIRQAYPELFQETLTSDELDRRSWDRIVFPLLSRGYLGIKWRARRANAPGCRLGFDGRLSSVSSWRLWLSSIVTPPTPPASFEDFAAGFPRPPLGETILLLGTSVEDLTAAARVRGLLPSSARASGPSSEQITLSSCLRALRQDSFDSVLIDAGAVSWRLIILFPLLAAKKAFFVNPNGSVDPLRLPSLLRRIRAGTLNGWAHLRIRPRVLFFQTESVTYSREALKRLSGIIPDARIFIVCHRNDASRLAKYGDAVVAEYWRGMGLGERLKLWQATRSLAIDFHAALFTGRPVFRWAKFLSLAAAGRKLLVFNSTLDCYWLKPSYLHWLLKKGQILFEEKRHFQKVLFIQTVGIEEVRAALKMLIGDQIFADSVLQVFCSEKLASTFSKLPEVSSVRTYKKRDWPHNFNLILKIFRNPPDLVVAQYSGNPTFRYQKLAFWLLPSRHRLLINQHGNYRFVQRRHFWLFSDSFPSISPYRLLLKGLTFFPRFYYLAFFLSAMKLRRAIVLSPKNPWIRKIVRHFRPRSS